MSEPYKKSDDGSWIEVTGFVRRLLADDNDGSRHQRFILDIGNRRTLLIVTGSGSGAGTNGTSLAG